MLEKIEKAIFEWLQGRLVSPRNFTGSVTTHWVDGRVKKIDFKGF